MTENKGITLLGVNLVYLFTAILLLTLGVFFQQKDILKGLLITEYILVLLPPIIYVVLIRDNFKNVFRFNFLSIKHGGLIIAITVLSYPVALFFNLIGMTILSLFGEIIAPPIPTADDLSQYFTLFFIIAVSAGICEEVFFRGLILRGYESLGKVQGIIISAVLFGVFHFNLQNFLGPVVLGLIFGYLVMRTNSIFAGILGHITNNGVAVTLGYLGNLASQKLGEENLQPQLEKGFDTFQLAAVTFYIGGVAILTGLGALYMINIIRKDTKEADHLAVKTCEQGKRFSWVAFLPIVLSTIIFIYLGYQQVKYNV